MYRDSENEFLYTYRGNGEWLQLAMSDGDERLAESREASPHPCVLCRHWTPDRPIASLAERVQGMCRLQRDAPRLTWSFWSCGEHNPAGMVRTTGTMRQEPIGVVPSREEADAALRAEHYVLAAEERMNRQVEEAKKQLLDYAKTQFLKLLWRSMVATSVTLLIVFIVSGVFG